MFNLKRTYYPNFFSGFDHRSLVINNIGRGPGENEGAIEDYLHLDEDEGRAWLLPSSGEHELAGINDINATLKPSVIY